MVGLGVLAYANSFGVPFLFDDLTSIPNNPNIRSLWPLSDAVKAPPQVTVAGRPIVSLSLALNYAFDGLNVRGYHAFNLAVHLVSALLLSAIVRRTLAGRGYGDAAPWLGLGTASLWMLHPLQTEAVTYVVQRTELLMGVFYLLTLYGAIRGWTEGRRGWFFVAALSSALGMASKEAMASAPLIVLLYDRVFVSGSFRSAWRRHAPLHTALAATWLVLAAYVGAGARSGTVGFSLGWSAADYLRTQAGVIVWYLRLALWPHPLSFLYDDWPRATAIAEVWPQALFLATAVAGSAWSAGRGGAAGFLGAWFFLLLAPSSSVVPIVTEIAAEHRMYLPLAAVVTGVVLGGYRLAAVAVERGAVERATVRALGMGAVGAVVVGYVLATAARNRDYASEFVLWRDVIAKRPGSAIAHSDLGTVLRAQGRLDVAIAEYRESLRLRPFYPEARFNLANALFEAGRSEEAAREYESVLRLRPDFWEARVNFGVLLLQTGRLSEAESHFRAALDVRPEATDARRNLAICLARQGRIDEALTLDPEVISPSPE